MAGQYDDNQSQELVRYLKVVRRRWLTVLLVTLLGLGAAAGYLVLKPSEARATTLVNVNVISLEPFSNNREPSGLIDASTEVQMARSSVVVSRTAEELGDDVTPAEVRSALQVELPAGGTVMRISYTAPTVRGAIVGADEAARQYLAYRGELAAQRLTRISEQLTEQRDLLRDDLLRVNQRLNSADPGSPQAVQADSDRQLINLQLDSLVSQINSINGIDTTGGTILTAANDVGAFLSPRRELVLAGGLAIGLLLGLVAAFARNAQDRRIFDAYDVADADGGPVLARLRAREATLPAAADDLDAVRSVWEKLLTVLPADHPVVAVADLSSRAVPSEVPVNMALAVCEMGRSVELVLPEFPQRLLGYLAEHLELTEGGRAHGITRYRSREYPALIVSVLGQPGLEVSPAAGVLKELLRGEERLADMTVVALPPTASRSVRLAAGRLAHAAVLVVARRTSRADVLRDVAGELRTVRAGIAGSVLLPRGRHLDDFVPPADEGRAARLEVRDRDVEKQPLSR